MAVYYDTAAIYIDRPASLCDKIERIDTIIDALLTNALVSAGKANIEEYSLNDGQTVIREKYRSSVDIEKAIFAFEKVKQVYVNRLNGRMVRLVDGKSINGGSYGY